MADAHGNSNEELNTRLINALRWCTSELRAVVAEAETTGSPPSLKATMLIEDAANEMIDHHDAMITRWHVFRGPA